MHRARKQLGDHPVFAGSEFIERRRTSQQLRLGVNGLTIED
ncbi:MAG: hypothetical protein ACI8PZ_007337 [Myxococcota bacterium]